MISAQPAPTLKQSQSTVSATTAPTPATPAEHHPHNAPAVFKVSVLSVSPVLPPAPPVPILETVSACAEVDISTSTPALLNVPSVMATFQDNARNVKTTVRTVMDSQPCAVNAKTDMPWIKSVEFAKKHLHANSDSTSPNHPMPAPESAHPTPTSMKMYVSPSASQVSRTMELEDASHQHLKPDAHIPIS